MFIHIVCNFKVNLITHLEVIALFSSNFRNVNTEEAITPNWVLRLTSKLQGR
jgi:hypothetical protein